MIGWRVCYSSDNGKQRKAIVDQGIENNINGHKEKIESLLEIAEEMAYNIVHLAKSISDMETSESADVIGDMIDDVRSKMNEMIEAGVL